MAGERIQARRPFTSPILEMVIREQPEPPEAEPVLPRDVAQVSDTEEAILEDVRQAFAQIQEIDEDDITVNSSFKFRRGFGQTDEYKILVDVSNASPEGVNIAVENMVDEGYLFEFVKFK